MAVRTNRFLQSTLATCIVGFLSACASTEPAPVSSVTPDYETVERGSYRGSYYKVNKGETLYFIAYVTGKDVKDLIAYNGLQAPYTIYPGQKIKLWRPKYIPPAYGQNGKLTNTKEPTVITGKTSPKKATTAPAVVTAPVVVTTPKALPTKPPVSTKAPASTAKVDSPVKAPKSAEQKTVNKTVDQPKSKEYSQTKESKQNVKTVTGGKTETVVKPKAKPSQSDKVDRWLWPTKGRVISKFSNAEQGNKGVDIAGQRGQVIVSTAPGTVVYSGNALRGYGYLIIIKHNDDYLSAYAHNERLLVKEGQKVKAGQKIATMGSSGTNSVRLHFEIRFKGKSVNPQRYLP